MANTLMTTRSWTLGGAALLLALMPACSGSKSRGPAPFPITGAWTGTATGGGTSYALVLADGTARILDADTSMASASLTMQGNALAGDVDLYNPQSPIAVSTGPTASTASGTGSATAFTPTFTPSSGTAWSYALTPDTAANVAVQLATLAGTYSATTTSAGEAAAITVTSDGSLIGSSGTGGTLAGILTATANGANSFTVTLTYAGNGGKLSKNLTGLAYYRPGTTPQIVLMTDNGNVQYSAVFSASAVAAVEPAAGRP